MINDLDSLFHITTEKEWDDCRGCDYYPKTFPSEGFIHFSTRNQLVKTANRIFIRRDLLFVLEIRKDGLEIVFENLVGGNELFPHLYDVLPTQNIKNKFFMKKNESGFFY